MIFNFGWKNDVEEKRGAWNLIGFTADAVTCVRSFIIRLGFSLIRIYSLAYNDEWKCTLDCPLVWLLVIRVLLAHVCQSARTEWRQNLNFIQNVFRLSLLLLQTIRARAALMTPKFNWNWNFYGPSFILFWREWIWVSVGECKRLLYVRNSRAPLRDKWIINNVQVLTIGWILAFFVSDWWTRHWRHTKPVSLSFVKWHVNICRISFYLCTSEGVTESIGKETVGSGWKSFKIRSTTANHNCTRAACKLFGRNWKKRGKSLDDGIEMNFHGRWQPGPWNQSMLSAQNPNKPGPSFKIVKAQKNNNNTKTGKTNFSIDRS